MNKLKNGIILASFFLATMFTGCGGPDNSNGSNTAAAKPSSNANTVSNDTQELGLLINMPYEPEELVWKEDKAHKKLVAVMRFSAEDSKKLADEAAKIKPAEKVAVPVETWFPDELQAQADQGSDDNLTGNAYPADAFFQEPYTQGRVIDINDSDYFVLEVASK